MFIISVLMMMIMMIGLIFHFKGLSFFLSLTGFGSCWSRVKIHVYNFFKMVNVKSYYRTVRVIVVVKR
jgi:hypothetical protein